ncbi:hypothetical protein BpHYR1_015387 [Brachionus plicatilis]|uniref:Uncharacterized protein n=1 Tax=Brachionus plicatilis TaxID=10195 RepID=A0A3M7PEZ5_BRAPC|nr:hypothetical protein BpHYR1_015387 [Brachionus plicatilis]
MKLEIIIFTFSDFWTAFELLKNTGNRFEIYELFIPNFDLNILNKKVSKILFNLNLSLFIVAIRRKFSKPKTALKKTESLALKGI